MIHPSFKSSSASVARFASPASRFPVAVFTFVVLAGLFPRGDTFAQGDPSRFLSWAYHDSGALLKEVGPKLPFYGLAGRGLLAPASAIDEQFLHEIQEGDSGVWGDYLDVTNQFGGPLMVIPLIGVFEASLFTKDTRFQDAAFTSLQAWIYSGLITGSLKYAFGRFRPESGALPTRYDFFSGHTSFPSGHTTAAFAIVTPWVLYYPSVFTYSLFALSTGTAIARIAHDKHWPSDVVAGAAVGFFTARWLSRRHQGSVVLPERRISVTPIISAEDAGVYINIPLR